MAFRFPFSNLHELNLDWILSKVKDLSDRVDNLDTEITDEIPQMKTDIETLQDEMPDKVNKTGDTLSGSLTYDGVYAILKNNNITDGVVPSADTYGNSAIMFRDHNGNNLGRVSPYAEADGDQSVMLLSQRKINNNNIFNYLRVGVDSSGNAYIYLSDAVAWLKALGLGTNGVLPITIAQGGTGATTAESAKRALGFSSNCNIDTFAGEQASTSDVLNVPSAYRGILFMSDSATNRNGAYMVYSTLGGSVTIIPILNATDLTFSTATNRLTITKPESSMTYFQISLVNVKITKV